MRKVILLLLFCSNITVNAQDIIVLNNGEIIKARVLEINKDDIKYKKFSNPQGPVYSIGKEEILSINYENGEKDLFTVKPRNHLL